MTAPVPTDAVCRLVARIASKITVVAAPDGPTVTGVPLEGPCWIWTHARCDRKGYGRIAVRQAIPGIDAGSNRLAHRTTYVVLVGPIPDGMTLDHLCERPACVNPAHCEPVTASENTKRQWLARLRLTVAAQLPIEEAA